MCRSLNCGVYFAYDIAGGIANFQNTIRFFTISMKLNYKYVWHWWNTSDEMMPKIRAIVF